MKEFNEADLWDGVAGGGELPPEMQRSIEDMEADGTMDRLRARHKERQRLIRLSRNKDKINLDAILDNDS